MKLDDLRYLDNAATTAPDPQVREFMSTAYGTLWGNPSSTSILGRAAKRELEVARDLLAGMLGASDFVFCGGGTEATNLVLRGGVDGHSAATILAGAADHPAVLETGNDLTRHGHTFVTYPVNEQGRPRMDRFAELVETHASSLRVVSLLHGNNENGTLAPIEVMAAKVREHAPDAHIHVDAVQSFAKIPVDLDRMGVDSITVAAHKIHGPKGIGGLALGPVRRPRVLITGGGQEHGLRCGTEDVVSARAFALAAENWISDQARETGRVREMRDRAQRDLFSQIEEVELLGDPETRLPHLLPIGIRGVRGSMVQEQLEARGILVSTGSACASEHRPESGSHVHAAMGIPTSVSGGALRISFGRLNEAADADELVKALPEIVRELRSTGVPQ